MGRGRALGLAAISKRWSDWLGPSLPAESPPSGSPALGHWSWPPRLHFECGRRCAAFGGSAASPRGVAVQGRRGPLSELRSRPHSCSARRAAAASTASCSAGRAVCTGHAAALKERSWSLRYQCSGLQSSVTPTCKDDSAALREERRDCFVCVPVCPVGTDQELGNGHCRGEATRVV